MTGMRPRWSGWEEVAQGRVTGERASKESTCAVCAQGLGDRLVMGMNETLSQYKGKDNGLVLAGQGQCGGK